LLVAEPMASDGLDPVAAYFGFYFLSMGQGRLRSPAQVGALLSRAGFAAFEERPTRQPLLSRLVVGRTIAR
jgi:demethylspheroidene O-methyltransferase